MSGLTLAAVTAGGGTLALASMLGRDGALDDDLQTIGDFKAGLVVTLVTEAELQAQDVPQLGHDFQSLGCRWVHFPVTDFGVPDPAAARKWAEISLTARAALRGGGRVLVHCMGGCGRSGMTVLRLMVEMGEDPHEALERIRAVRPCAVETDAQLAWATQGLSGR